MIGNIKDIFKKTPWVKVICFMLVFFLLVSAVQYALLYRDRDTDNSSYQVVNFYKEKKDSLDAVFIGSSCCFSFYSPLFAYNAYGIKTSNYASSGMGMIAFKYIVDEVKKSQPNAPIIISLTDQDEMEYKSLHYLADYMPMSMNKLNLLKDYFSKEDESLLNSAEFFFPLMRFHERWSEMTLDDLIIDDGTKGATRHQYYLTYVTDVTQEYITSNKKAEPPETWTRRISDLLDYCDENHYEVMFLVPPKTYKEEKYQMMNSLIDLIENRGYYVLDLREKTDEIGLDLTYDYYDKYHTNVHGSLKYTDYIAKMLMERYGVQKKDKETDDFSKAFDTYYEKIEPYVIFEELDAEHRDYKLARPELVSALTSNKGVELNWEEVSEADGYTVYRNDGSTWVALTDLSDTQYIDTDTKQGRYTVFSYRLDGNDKIYGNYDYQGIEAGVK